VRTKRAKTFTTWFFPVGDGIRQIVLEWVAFLRTEKGFGPEDPILPKARIEPGPDRVIEYQVKGQNKVIRVESIKGKLVRSESYEIARGGPIELQEAWISRAWSADGERLYLADAGKTVRVVETASGPHRVAAGDVVHLRPA